MMKITFTFILPFIVVFILFFSCNPKGNNPATNSPTPLLKNDTLHIIKEFKGLLVNGKNEKKFISCDHPELIHLVKNIDQMDTLIKNLLPYAYDGESIFLQMQAEIKSSPDKKYSDLLLVKKIIKTEQKNPTNTCIPFDFWCKGNEPFWQVEISEKENLIDFYDPMQQKTTHFLYNKQKIKDGTIEYVSKDENLKNTIIIRIKTEKCSDGMSEKEYHYSVEVILNEKKYSGCALKYGG